MQLALYMASYRTRWAALSSHNSWIFFRLYKGTEGNNAFLTFSSVVSLHPIEGEGNSSRTKPLRAFLGMLVATARDIAVRRAVGVHYGEAEEVVLVEAFPEGDDVGGWRWGLGTADCEGQCYGCDCHSGIGFHYS